MVTTIENKMSEVNISTDGAAMPMRTAAQQSAFEKCKIARQAALERKRATKAEAKATKAVVAPPPPAPVQEPEAEYDPAPEPEAEVEAAPELVPVVEPSLAPPTPMNSPADPNEDLEFVDADDILQVLQQQSDALASLRDEVRGMREHQLDLSSSFTRHGVTQHNALNFV
jgi:hypothetical protein